MTLGEAIKKRLENLCIENKMNVNQLGIAAGINPTTIRSSLKQRTSTPNIATLYYICIGLNISIKDFFDDKLFDIENIDD